MGISAGRPRLDHDKTFREAFARILPPLLAGEISKGEAARRLGISRRSLSRYIDSDQRAQALAQADAMKRLFERQRSIFQQ